MLYDCDACPAYCCAYPIIEVKKKDIRRLARHFGVSADEAKAAYTAKENNRVRKMKQHYDAKLDADICVLLDRRTRQCTVYHARPQICRDYPGDRCEWHDRRMFETMLQGKGATRKVIRLRVEPWTIDADYRDYTSENTAELLDEYANPKKRKIKPRAAR